MKRADDVPVKRSKAMYDHGNGYTWHTVVTCRCCPAKSSYVQVSLHKAELCTGGTLFG